MSAFLAVLESLAKLALVLADKLDGGEEREAMFRAAEELASLHARLKFSRLREDG